MKALDHPCVILQPSFYDLVFMTGFHYFEQVLADVVQTPLLAKLNELVQKVVNPIAKLAMKAYVQSNPSNATISLLSLNYNHTGSVLS